MSSLLRFNGTMKVGNMSEAVQVMLMSWLSTTVRVRPVGAVGYVSAAIVLDWPRKRLRIGAPLKLGGDLDRDLRALQSFYEGVSGRNRPSRPSRIP